MKPKAEPVVSSFKSGNRFKRLVHGYHPVIIVIVVVVVAILLAFFIEKHRNDINASKNAAFVIAGKDYPRTSIKVLITYAVSQGDTKSQAAHEAYNLYLDQAAATKLNIVVPQSSINAEKSLLMGRLTNQHVSAETRNWFNLLAYDYSLQNIIKTGEPAHGYVYLFWFNQHEDYAPAAPTSIPGNGNPTLIAQDRAYAHKEAETYLRELKSDKITSIKLISAIDNEPKLNTDNITGSNGSKQFGNSTISTWQDSVGIPDIVEFINDQKHIGISTVQVGTETVPKSVRSSGKVDSYYYIVQLNVLPAAAIGHTRFNGAVQQISSTYNGLGK